MSKGYYLFKFDLKYRYHHVEVFPDRRKYLAFACDFGDGLEVFSIRGFAFWFVDCSLFVLSC